VAPLYRSEPVSPIPQPEYLNTVALGHGLQEPEELLAGALAVEAELGRRRNLPLGPRRIDLDLLFVGDLERDAPGLRLPHPRLRERRFVLAPLADLVPDLALPPDGRRVGDLLAALSGGPWVKRLRSEDPCC
jgi:2-amino-4-hydroxy-6-hydroxymethyldihydropteridine diphosphokinase